MSEFKTIWQPVPSWDNMVKDRLTTKFPVAERLPKLTKKTKELSKCEKLGVCSPSDKTCSKCQIRKLLKFLKVCHWLITFLEFTIIWDQNIQMK